MSVFVTIFAFCNSFFFDDNSTDGSTITLTAIIINYLEITIVKKCKKLINAVNFVIMAGLQSLDEQQYNNLTSLESSVRHENNLENSLLVPRVDTKKIEIEERQKNCSKEIKEIQEYLKQIREISSNIYLNYYYLSTHLTISKNRILSKSSQMYSQK